MGASEKEQLIKENHIRHVKLTFIERFNNLLMLTTDYCLQKGVQSTKHLVDLKC